MDDHYDRLLYGVDRIHRNDLDRALKVLSVSCRPLSYQELVDICAADTEYFALQNGGRYESLDVFLATFPGIIDFETTEKDVEDGTMVDLQLNARITEPGLLEYLQSERIQRRAASKLAFDTSRAHTEMARVCLSYLLSDTLSQLRLNENGEMLRDFPFADYAARYWYYHYSKGDESAGELQRYLNELFLTSTASFSNWVRLCDIDSNPKESRSLTREDADVPSRLYYASLLDLTQTVDQLNSLESETQTNLRLGRYGTPLQAACAKGHLGVVKVLLTAGTDVNERGGEYLCALNAAVNNGRADIVQALIDHNVDVETRLERDETVFHWAAFHSFHDILIMLLRRAPDFWAYDEHWRAPLHWAIDQGHMEVSTILAQHNNGRFLIATDTLDQTPLHLAVRRCEWAENFAEAKALVKMLISNGSNVDAQNCSGKTCLHEVAAFGEFDTFQNKQLRKEGDVNISNRRLQMTELLLQQKCKTEIRDLNGLTGLDIAMKLGKRDVVEKLTGESHPSMPSEGFTPIYSSLRPWVSEVLNNPYSSQKVSKYLTAYNMVHDYCVATRTHDANEPTHRVSSSTDRTPLYYALKQHIYDYINHLSFAHSVAVESDYVRWYLREWAKLQAASKRITNAFRYLDRHVVNRNIDEGHQRTYHVHDLLQIEWKQQLLLAKDRKFMISTILGIIEVHEMEGEIPDPRDTAFLQTFTELIWPGKLSVSQLNSFLLAQHHTKREGALRVLLEWSSDIRELKLLNVDPLAEWPMQPALKLLVDLIGPDIKLTGKGGHGCNTIKAAMLTGAPLEHQYVIRQQDIEMIAGQFDVRVMDLLLTEHSDEVKLTEAVMSAAALNKPHAKEMVRYLLDRHGDNITVKVDDTVLRAACQNRDEALDLVTLLVERRGDDLRVDESVLQAAAENGQSGLEIVTLLHSQYANQFTINEDVLKTAARNEWYGLDLMKFFLEQCGDQVLIGEVTVESAIMNYRLNLQLTTYLLEERGHEFKVTQDLVKAIPPRCRHEDKLKKLLKSRL